MERLVSFLKLPEEAPEVTEVRPPAGWPDKGAIEIQDLRMRCVAFVRWRRRWRYPGLDSKYRATFSGDS